jgi:hypothetical protein
MLGDGGCTRALFHLWSLPFVRHFLSGRHPKPSPISVFLCLKQSAGINQLDEVLQLQHIAAAIKSMLHLLA